MEGVTAIGVIGNGMIGDSMTVLTTGHGYKTVSLVRDMAKTGKYKAAYDEYFRQMMAAGVIDERRFRACERLLCYTDDYSSLAGCQVIFECVSEDLAVKRQVYSAIEANCPDILAICSVSSSLLPDVLGEGLTKYADRVVVTHPFNPAHMVPYFEICAGERTAPGVVPWVMALLESLDRKPVALKKPSPGFIGNRLQFALWREALNLVEQGVAGPEDIDACLKYSFCPHYTSIGIFEHFDNGDLRLNASTCANVFPTLANTAGVPGCITERIENGDTGAGAESRRGFYDWNGVDMQAYAKRVSAPYWQFLNWEFPE